jgi:hypothetical protein
MRGEVGLGSPFGDVEVVASAARPSQMVHAGEKSALGGEVASRQYLGLKASDAALFIMVGDHVAVPV